MIIRPWHVITPISLWLLLAWTAVIVFDVLNLFRPEAHAEAIVWQHLFANGKPVEWVQWYVLSGAVVLAGFVAARTPLNRSGSMTGVAKFWLVMAVAFAIMLVEDAGNVRHEIRHIVEAVSGQAKGTSLLDKSVEFTYFALIATVPLYALVRLMRYLRPYTVAFIYALLGFGFYGIAVSGNATRNWGEWYGVVGARIQAYFDLPVPEHSTPHAYGQWLLDALFEESLELLGAMFFLAATVAFLGYLRASLPQPEKAGAPKADGHIL